jgi:alpha-galactosidase
LSAINDFELQLFGNEEVIAVNQDRLGIAATRIRETRARKLGSNQLHNSRIQARPLADGSIAVGIFNLSEESDTISILAEDLNIPRRFKARNLWERRDIGSYDTSLEIEVPSHGAQMLQIYGK